MRYWSQVVYPHATWMPAGDNLLSKFVNFLINTPPLYSMMKVLAKQAMKNSAESRGISWDGHVQRMKQTAEVGTS